MEAESELAGSLQPGGNMRMGPDIFEKGEAPRGSGRALKDRFDKKIQV